MGLDAKKYTRFYATSGTDADKVADTKLAEVRAKWEADVAAGNNLNLLEHPLFGPVIYQMQQMQDEFDSVRDHVVNDIVGQQGPKGDKGDTGNTGATGAAGAAGANGAAGADGKDAGVYTLRSSQEVYIPSSYFVGVDYIAYASPVGTTISNARGTLHAMWPGVDGKTVDKVFVHTDSRKAIPKCVVVSKFALGTSTILATGVSSDTLIDITDWTCAMNESLSISITPGSTTTKIYGASLILK